MVNCPKCSFFFRKEKMQVVAHPSGASLDVCARCGGMWLDKDEVKLLYERARVKNGKK